MSRPKPATVRFYFDADVQGLAHVVARLRSDATYPGDRGATIGWRVRPACSITSPETDDEVWIPLVTAREWLIITRDSRIQQHRAELAAVRDNGARMVALAGPDAIGTWAQLEVLLSQWRKIEALLRQPGPFVFTATRNALTRVELG